MLILKQTNINIIYIKTIILIIFFYLIPKIKGKDLLKNAKREKKGTRIYNN